MRAAPLSGTCLVLLFSILPQFGADARKQYATSFGRVNEENITTDEASSAVSDTNEDTDQLEPDDQDALLAFDGHVEPTAESVRLPTDADLLKNFRSSIASHTLAKDLSVAFERIITSPDVLRATDTPHPLAHLQNAYVGTYNKFLQTELGEKRNAPFGRWMSDYRSLNVVLMNWKPSEDGEGASMAETDHSFTIDTARLCGLNDASVCALLTWAEDILTLTHFRFLSSM